MATDGRELLAVALGLEAEELDDELVVAELLEAAEDSPTALMGAYAFALSLARDMPYDTSNERTLAIITRALQRAVRASGERHDSEATAGLLSHIVEVSGRAAVAPQAVAERVAEVDADVGILRHASGDDLPEPGVAAG
ncbi:MAG TPA: hypothetical protein VM242_03405 [Acidimicrobiales bacterium]|jgi:hypothetical protein|nr:hypothetical protein [Acidimicrobiales bacterium]